MVLIDRLALYLIHWQRDAQRPVLEWLLVLVKGLNVVVCAGMKPAQARRLVLLRALLPRFERLIRDNALIAKQRWRSLPDGWGGLQVIMPNVLDRSLPQQDRNADLGLSQH